MDELKAEAEALGIVVDARWNARTLQERIDAARAASTPAPVAEKLFPVKLTKNYMPMGAHKVIEAVTHEYHGVGQVGKLWAGTVVELPRSEAVRLMQNVAVSVETVKDGFGNPVKRRIEKPMPLAERADAVPI